MKRILFFLCFLFLCAIDVNSQKQSIVLSDFTKEIVDLMIDKYYDENNEWMIYYEKGGEKNEYIIIDLRNNGRHSKYGLYSMSIDVQVSNDELWLYSDAVYRYLFGHSVIDFWGSVRYRGKTILIFGDKKTPFVLIRGKSKNFDEIFNIEFEFVEANCCPEYDPLSWHIVLDDELKLDTVKTAIYDYDQDISDIVNVAKKYFNGGK